MHLYWFLGSNSRLALAAVYSLVVLLLLDNKQNNYYFQVGFINADESR